MKNRLRLFSIILMVLTIASCIREQENTMLNLDTQWKFRTGDDLRWATPEFNDSSWAQVRPTIRWEEQGFKDYNGIGWYRVKVMIPSSLKKDASQSDSLQLFLGKIDDCDQVFLNGKEIGENGRTIFQDQQPDSAFIKVSGMWNLQRKYILAASDPRILWDKENTIAVRCFDQDGPGGMYDKRFELSMTSLKDRIQFDFNTEPFILEDSGVIKKVAIRNLSKHEEFNGELIINVIDCKDGICIWREKSGMLLTQGVVLEKSVKFKRLASVPVILKVEFREAKTGKSVKAETEVPYILTPKVSDQPRINSASIFGVRPYSPFLFKVAATGTKPLKYKAEFLPAGLTINENTGLITGMLKKKGEQMIRLRVENSLGLAQSTLKIVVGEVISLTPPLGWNSWNCWGLSVSDQKVRQSASEMAAGGLIDHGWTYINIDDGWQDTHDKNGNILPNSKFPDMRGLCDYVHNQGLKIGIYSSPGTKTCGGYEGSYKYEEKDAQTYASWGFDYLKYDWCSYSAIAPKPNLEQMKKPYKDMRHALRKTNRDIHYSLCQYGMGEVWQWGQEVDGNSWRTTGDIEDTWESLSTIGFGQNGCSPWSAPGRWNDPDMLVVGWVGWGPALHYTRLTTNEQYTHISLWSLLASPLLIGCDLSRLDAFTLNLLTNDEVLRVNQDPLGQQASLVYKTDSYQVWARDLADGNKAVGLFNLTDKPVNIPVEMSNLCLNGKYNLRDVWSQTDLGLVRTHFEMSTQPHGVRLVLLTEKTRFLK